MYIIEISYSYIDYEHMNTFWYELFHRCPLSEMKKNIIVIHSIQADLGFLDSGGL